MSNEVDIKLGEQGAGFAKRYGDIVRVDHATPSVTFYQINWNKRQRGIAKVVHGQFSFVIDDVLSIQTYQSLHNPSEEGLSEFAINSGITEPTFIPHDEARLKTYAILQRILDAGWQQVISRSRPRLGGEDRLNYALAGNSIALDARYLPTFGEWMRIESHTPWTFYADGLYLEVTFTREPDYTDPQKPGAYLLSFNLKTENEYFRAYAAPEKRAEWKSIVPGELIKVAKMRAEKEAELRAKGIPIDDTYQDPPVPNLN